MLIQKQYTTLILLNLEYNEGIKKCFSLSRKKKNKKVKDFLFLASNRNSIVNLLCFNIILI